MTQPANNEPQFSSLIFLGAMRSIAGFPFEHPLELMKITAQANPKHTFLQIICGIVKERDVFGFSDTILTNFPRRVLREAVRCQLLVIHMNNSLENFQKHLPEKE